MTNDIDTHPLYVVAISHISPSISNLLLLLFANKDWRCYFYLLSNLFNNLERASKLVSPCNNVIVVICSALSNGCMSCDQLQRLLVTFPCLSTSGTRYWIQRKDVY